MCVCAGRQASPTSLISTTARLPACETLYERSFSLIAAPGRYANGRHAAPSLHVQTALCGTPLPFRWQGFGVTRAMPRSKNTQDGNPPAPFCLLLDLFFSVHTPQILHTYYTIPAVKTVRKSAIVAFFFPGREIQNRRNKRPLCGLPRLRPLIKGPSVEHIVPPYIHSVFVSSY